MRRLAVEQGVVDAGVERHGDRDQVRARRAGTVDRRSSKRSEHPVDDFEVGIVGMENRLPVRPSCLRSTARRRRRAPIDQRFGPLSFIAASGWRGLIGT